jgi:hypothetical protein
MLKTKRTGSIPWHENRRTAHAENKGTAGKNLRAALTILWHVRRYGRMEPLSAKRGHQRRRDHEKPEKAFKKATPVRFSKI